LHVDVGSLAGAGNVINNNSVGTLVLGADNSSTTYSGVISGSSGIEKVGTGVLTLAGLNTYTGETLITAGTLRLGVDNALSNQTVVNVLGTFDMNGMTDQIGALTGTGNVTNNNNVDGLTTNDNGDDTVFSGVISGTGSLTKAGQGTLTLSGVNTYTGATVIGDGVLQIGVNNALSSTTTLSIDNDALLDLNGFSTTVGSLAGSGLVVNGQGGNDTLTIGGNNTSTSFGGTIFGEVSLTKVGTGTQTLSGSNIHEGPTTVSAGTLRQGTDFALSFISDHVVNGTLDLGGFAAEVASLAGSGNVINNDDEFITNGSGASTTFSGVISGPGDLVKLGEGTLTLSGSNTYTGETIIEEGTLRLGRNNALSSMTAVDVVGTFDMNGFTNTIGSLSGEGSVINNDNAGGLLTNGNGDDTVFAGVLSGLGGLTKQGAGTLTLNAENTYLGATLVSAGTLQNNTNNALPTNTALTVNGTYDMNFFSQEIGSLAGSGNILNNDEGLMVGGNGTSTSYSGAISGGGQLNKVGAGTLTLTGANTYTGGTDLDAGTLSGTTVSLQGNIGNDSFLIFNQGFQGTYSGDINGAGSVTKQGTGTVVFTGANSYTGGTTVSAGTLQGNTDSLQGNILNNSSLVFDQVLGGTYEGVVSGTGTFTKQGAGSLQLNSAQTYTGATMVNEGILRLGASNLLPDGSAVTVNGTLDLNANNETIGSLAGSGVVDFGDDPLLTVGGTNASTTFSGGIVGTGDLTKVGTGTFTLTGENTFDGLTTISAGRLDVNSPGFIEGSVLVGAAGVLGGTGTVGSVTALGRMAPGNSIGTLFVDGDYTQQAGSTYEAELNGNGTSDLIDVDGNATLQAGSALQLIAQASAFSVGQRFTIVQADAVTGTYTTTTHNFSGSFVPTLFYNATMVQVVLASNLSGAANLTGNQLTIARILDAQSVLDPTGDLLAVLNALNPLGAAELDTVLRQIAPEELGNTAAAGVAVGGRFQRNAVQHLHDLLGLGNTGNGTGPTPRSMDTMHYLMPPDDLASPSDGGAGPSAPPGTGGDALRWGGWASGFGGTGDVDGNDDAEGFSS
ncbi:MAG: autotransporter-associated beta strand repeat-containing protein, partial [Planctomycetota bacterium]